MRMTRTALTLCMAVRPDRVLLGMKKRGFGAGRWNGFGGKLLPGESVEVAARREMTEECGIHITAMEPAGRLEFRFAEKPEGVLDVHVFRVLSYTGEPVETEEMQPQWFPLDAIPFDAMWPDDRYWIPLFLAGKYFQGSFLFGPEDTLLEMKLGER